MKPNNKTAATKSTPCTVATGIQCVRKLFTFYSVILFISLHNNSPLKYMCIILPAHPNAISRGDGHFLNCPRVRVCARVFFFRVFHFVHLLRFGMLVCSRVFFFFLFFSFTHVAILLLSHRLLSY